MLAPDYDKSILRQSNSNPGWFERCVISATIDKMDNSQIIRMDDRPYIKKWFRGYEYWLSIETESTLKFISLDRTEEVFEYNAN